MENSTHASCDAFLPVELAGHTVESLQALHGPERRGIYWLILTGVIGALATLPVIHLDVSVRAPGFVRSVTERTNLQAAVSGRIGEVLVSDNESVVEGQVLLVLTTGELDEQLRRQRAMQVEAAVVMEDLRVLLSGVESSEALQTPALRHELAQFQAQWDAYRLAEAKAGSELARYTTLADKGIATRQELDNVRFEAERLQAESKLFQQQARARWSARLREERATCDDLLSSIRRLQEQRAHYEVRAPVGGVLVGFNGWSVGAQVMAGQALGAVSPTDELRVESLVSSRDIGLVRSGQPVRMQIDAYPYTQWGMVGGEVETISGDLLGGTAGAPGNFKVLIRPATTHLVLPSGVRGELKKGLTLTARYVVSRRSLLQLLYDDASAWFNPQANLKLFSTGHP